MLFPYLRNLGCLLNYHRVLYQMYSALNASCKDLSASRKVCGNAQDHSALNGQET